MKNTALVLSLIVNALAAAIFFNPVRLPGPKMTCFEARSEIHNKQAARDFLALGNDFWKLQAFLRASDYQLRNINFEGGVTFVYTATRYPSACGWHLPGVDGTIIRVQTDLTTEPKVTGVY